MRWFRRGRRRAMGSGSGYVVASVTLPDSVVMVPLSRILAGQRHAPVVYFALMGDGTVKIGTSENLAVRMRSLYVPLDDVLAVVPGGRETEDAFHKRFEKYQVHGGTRRELFRLEGRLERFLSGHPDEDEKDAAQPAPPPEPAPFSEPIPSPGLREPPSEPLASVTEYAALRGLSRPRLHTRRQRWRNKGWPEVAGHDEANKDAELFVIRELDEHLRKHGVLR